LVHYYSNMKKLITSGFLFTLVVSGIAQENKDDLYKKPLVHSTVADRVNASVFMGAAVASTNFRTGPITSGAYIAPFVGYRFTEKFRLNIGVMHYTVNGNSYVPITLNENRYATGRQNYSGNLFVLEGQYKLTHQLMLSGDLMYDSNPLMNTQRSFKAAALGLDYKVSPHTTLSVKTAIIQSNGYNVPYSNSPFGANPIPMMGMSPLPFNTYPTTVSPANF
jgi:hypothetical protein